MISVNERLPEVGCLCRVNDAYDNEYFAVLFEIEDDLVWLDEESENEIENVVRWELY